MSNVLIKPKNGARVRKPDGGILAEAGEQMPRNSYWLRREKDGDVTISELPAEKPAAKAAPKTEPK